jgi:hypothetical protein
VVAGVTLDNCLGNVRWVHKRSLLPPPDFRHRTLSAARLGDSGVGRWHGLSLAMDFVIA